MARSPATICSHLNGPPSLPARYSQRRHFRAVANEDDIAGQHRVIPGLPLEDRPPREEPAPEPAAVVEAVPDPVPAQDNSEVIELIRSLQAQVDALSKPAPEAESPVSEGENEALATLQGELEELRQQAENRERELQDRITNAQKQFRDRNRIIQEAAQVALAQIERTLIAVIRQVSESRGMNLVLHRAQVALNINEFDIT